jgi:TP53 regulating kinase-like protein
MRKISEGAEAELYETSFLGLRAVLKRRSKKGYRVERLDTRIRLTRTKTEARLLEAAARLVRCPAVLMVGKYEIWLERVDGTTLNALVEKGSLKEARYCTIAGVAGGYLGKLHTNNIVHGDYTPANLMLDRNGRLWVIDFGLAEDSNALEEMALDVLLIKRAIPVRAYSRFMKSYCSEFGRGSLVLNKLKEIERRGRYQTRSLLTA